MAIASSAMNNNNQDHHHQDSNKQLLHNDDDEHEYDVVMPGFRFHPTEEELVEFYLRRKVEGKRFNVELITFLDLYRHDPWELPALAAIGEKEWYFYVPRDKKYRNGDRPNRVTTSGYWKATGADRMIRSENFRSIGLKKTLVFYSGKAPKGIRTSWIMNEYRLPLQETERLQKAEISLCRVYKRAGVEDHPSLPRSLPTRPSSSSSSSSSRASQLPSKNHHPHEPEPVNNRTAMEKFQSSTYAKPSHRKINEIISSTAIIPPPPISLQDHNDQTLILLQSKQALNSSLSPNCTTIFTNDDLHKLVNNINNIENPSQYNIINNNNNNVPNLLSQFSTLQPNITQPPPPPQPAVVAALNVVPAGSFQATPFSDRLWDWNAISEASNKDFTSLFK
ncbi:hypothetical protein DH2020_044985 [Rehmannia glutinosa]|uniref:NAC domain-containing protein n=1 Tax=Rehmannia glutinosa TaxID=99300 RepID=A0ABR0UFH7_REHGL